MSMKSNVKASKKSVASLPTGVKAVGGAKGGMNTKTPPSYTKGKAA